MGGTSLRLLVKANFEKFLCLPLASEALEMKGVEKGPHSWLTAVKPEMMGVRAQRESYLLQGERSSEATAS